MPISNKPKNSRSNKGLDSDWYLEGFAQEGKTWIIPLKPIPFIIGRQEGCDLRLSSSQISRRHAQIYHHDSALWIREFGSTNGTFVNRERLSEDKVLCDGDILHFGPLEFRIHCKKALIREAREGISALTQISLTDLPQGFVDCETEFAEMLRRRAVIPYFQPIVRLSDQKVIGHELLGRSDFAGVPSNPTMLLMIARKLGKEIELSELFRQTGIQRAIELGGGYQLFFNTVPAEMKLPHLQHSLEALRLQASSLPLAMEVHETAVTKLTMMKTLRALLNDLDIQLVYDDFGAGQARLLELSQVPPDWLKFDISLIHNIHRQAPTAQKVLQTLVYMAGDLGVKTLAEGIEIEEEMEVCVRFGFDFVQGYYFGKPAPGFRDNEA